MMHSTGNEHMPFIAIPHREEITARFDWLAKYTLVGLVGIFVLGVLMQFTKPAPSEAAPVPGPRAPASHAAPHRPAPAAVATRTDSTARRERDGTINPSASRIGATASRTRPTLDAVSAPPDAKPVPASALRPLSSRSAQAAAKQASAPVAPPPASAPPNPVVSKPALTVADSPPSSPKVALPPPKVVLPPPKVVSPPPKAAPLSPPALPHRALTTALDSGVFAYEQSQYDAAALAMRRALGARGVDSLTGSRRLTALAYLGAAEFSRNNRDSATAAFRALIAEAPHRSLDGFSPSVTDFYTGIRRSLSGLARLQETDRGFVITLLAITPHYVSVEVLRDDGRRVVSLYDGHSADSLSLNWDRRGSDGVIPPPGHYQIVVTARAADGRVLNVARFPVTTR